MKFIRGEKAASGPSPARFRYQNEWSPPDANFLFTFRINVSGRTSAHVATLPRITRLRIVFVNLGNRKLLF